MKIKPFRQKVRLFFIVLITGILLVTAGRIEAGITVECDPETQDPCVSADGSVLRCVPKGECCWKRCDDGSCSEDDYCCPGDRSCETRCVDPDDCCPEERECSTSGAGGRPICVEQTAGCCPEDERCPDGITCVCSGVGCPGSRRCCPGERICYGSSTYDDYCAPECQPCSDDWKICIRNGRCVEIPQNNCCEECVEGEQECLKGQCKDILVDTDPDNDPSIPGAIYNKHTKDFTDSDWFSPNGPTSGPYYVIRQRRVRRNLDAGRYEVYYEDTYCPTGTYVHGTAKAPNGLLIAVCGVWKCTDPDCQGSQEDPCRGHLYTSTSASAHFELANGQTKYAATLPDRCDGINICEAECFSDNNGGKIAIPYLRSCPNNGHGCSSGACNP